MMNMTNEQRELLKTIVENKENLEELLKFASIERKQAKELKIGESITVAEIPWSKFAEDGEGNAYMLADKSIDKMKFGKNNDWRESQIRKELNDNFYKKIVSDLGKDSVLPIMVDLLSHDGLDDYGKCEDMISLLTYDLYRNNRKNIKDIKKWHWTCIPDSTPSGYGSGNVRCIDSDGSVNYLWCDRVVAVRPFFILKADAFVSCDKMEN